MRSLHWSWLWIRRPNMRLLLDESLPWRLRRLLVGHEASSVQRMGWSGVQNGELLRPAAPQFNAFITADQNIQFQQNLAALPMSVFVLVSHSTALSSLAPLVPALLKLLSEPQAPKTLIRIGG
jgi:predicted nuclease of predicted toxin-antitoxin system